MEIEHTVKSFPIDEKLQSEIDALIKDGWNIVPGVAPVAVYHLVRVKPEPSGQGVGKLTIDDSKIFVIPADTKAN